ncbi:MAG: cobalt-precorrin-6A reductase [Cyanobacteria bacterium P01_C01_bin.72]
MAQFLGMNSQVWLIGGTSESVAIAQALAKLNIPLVITVTTASAQALYTALCKNVSTAIKVIVGSMNPLAMQSFCQQQQIKIVIDASHPYAATVSRQAIALTTQLGIPYLRYERASHHTSSGEPDSSQVIELSSFTELLAGDYLDAHRVLLTVGCQALSQFQPWHSKATLFARVLPKIKSLETAIAAGFTGDRLIAIRPPISLAMETALWQQWQISLVVTKASGKAGGEDLKRQVAASLGIPLIVIARPQIVYPRQTSEIWEIVAFCRQC